MVDIKTASNGRKAVAAILILDLLEDDDGRNWKRGKMRKWINHFGRTGLGDSLETAKALKRIRFFAKAVTFTDSESEGYTSPSLNDLYGHIIDPNSHPCNKLEKTESKEPTPSQFLIGVCFNKCTEPTNHKVRSPKTPAKKETRNKRNVAARKKGGLSQTGEKEKGGNLVNKHYSSPGTSQQNQPSISHYPRNNLLPEAPRSWEIGQINDLTKFTRKGRTHQVLPGDQNEGPSHVTPVNQSSAFQICQGQMHLNLGQQNKVKDWRNYNPCNQGTYQANSKTKGKSKFIKSSAATSTATTNNYNNNNNGTAIIVVRPPSDQQKVICENIKIIKCSESHIVQKPVNVVNLVKSLEKVDKSFMDLLEIKHEGNSSTGQMSATKGDSVNSKSDKIRGNDGILAKDSAIGKDKSDKITNRGNGGPLVKDSAIGKDKSDKITNRGNGGPLVKDTGKHTVKADCKDSKDLKEDLKNTTQEKRKHHMTTTTQKQAMSKAKLTVPGVNNAKSLAFDMKKTESTVIGNSGDKATQNIQNIHQGSITNYAFPSSLVQAAHTTSSSTEKNRTNNKRSVAKSKLTDVPDSIAPIRKITENVTQLFESILTNTKESAKEGSIDLASDNGVIAVETASNALALRFQELESSAVKAHKDSVFPIEKISIIASGTKVATQAAEDDVIRLQELSEAESKARCEVQNTNFSKGAGYKNALEGEGDSATVFAKQRNLATATGSLALKENPNKGTSITCEGGHIVVDNATNFGLQGDFRTAPVCEITTEECTKSIKAKSKYEKVKDTDAKMKTSNGSSEVKIHEKCVYGEKVLIGSQIEGHYLNFSSNDFVAKQTISENRFPIVRVEKISDHHFVANKKDSLKSCKLGQGNSKGVTFGGSQERPEKSESTKSEEKLWKDGKGSSMCTDDIEGRSHRTKANLCAQKSSFKNIDEVVDNRQEIRKDVNLKSENMLSGETKNTPYINASVHNNQQATTEAVVDNARAIEKSSRSPCDRSPKRYDRNSITEPINYRLRSANLSNGNEGLNNGDTYATAKGSGITVAFKTKGKRKRVLPDEKVMDKCDKATDNKRVSRDLKRKKNKQAISPTRGRRPRPKRNIKQMKRYY